MFLSKEQILKTSSLPPGGMVGNRSHQMKGCDFNHSLPRHWRGHGKDNEPVNQFRFIIVFDAVIHKFPKIVRLDDNIR